MVNKIKYPALNAKMKGIYASNFHEEDYDELNNQSTLKDAISFLKSKFPNLNITESMHRIELEQELNNLFISNILKLNRYLSDLEKEVLMNYLEKYEINCVKNVFRNLVTNRNAKVNLRNIDNWTTSLFPSIDGINDIDNLNDFYSFIESEDYYYIFLEFKDKYMQIPIEQIEIELDKFYFMKMYRIFKSENSELENMIGSEIDLLNISWICRSKKYFDYSDDVISDLLIPINYKISKGKKESLVKANNFNEIKSILKSTTYKNVFTDEEHIEKDINTYLYTLYKKYFKTKLFNLCTVFCNINMIDIEIKNIINIIEGIRYNMDRKEIQKKIIV